MPWCSRYTGALFFQECEEEDACEERWIHILGHWFFFLKKLYQGCSGAPSLLCSSKEAGVGMLCATERHYRA